MSNLYRSRDIADRLGISLDTFYRRRERLERDDGMPRPLCSGGRHAYEKTGMDAWLTRFHPYRPPPAANDVCAPLVPMTDEEHRGRLLRAYGSAS
ncbi:hypothetical protein [Afipia felis]|uniref:DNA-binding protein n=2 Tax=Afipia felis TaxID=1035 RepID=A0A381AYM5_AFIFE|nr:hypothetical protein [Afipia felis]EKS26715.1 hypothetical protein HMPREF9697_04018 [Afipia felis ATCC 53690]SUU76135.1 Uncharacterised protein [Afipia felis]SUU84202.1 Uncharacterised protein [Afipia felis]SUW28245.1 Uncharacterised protein [Afipia felis]